MKTWLPLLFWCGSADAIAADCPDRAEAPLAAAVCASLSSESSCGDVEGVRGTWCEALAGRDMAACAALPEGQDRTICEAIANSDAAGCDATKARGRAARRSQAYCQAWALGDDAACRATGPLRADCLALVGLKPRWVEADAAADAAPASGGGSHADIDPQEATEVLGFYDRFVPYKAPESTGQVVYVGNGGAGLAGLLEHLAADFHATPEGRGVDIVWVKAHTDENFAFLRDRDNPMQLALTYDLEAEARLAEEGVLEDAGSLVFLDHFQVVGPEDGLARLELTDAATGVELAREAARRGRATQEPTWLFREGASATSTRTRAIFAEAGFPLEDSDFGTWIVEVDAYPPAALVAATEQGLFTLTDVGTTRAAGWVDDKSGTGLAALATGSNRRSDPLLNPCSVIARAGLAEDDPARLFAAWLVSEDGQSSVSRFTGAEGGAPYYATAGMLTD